MTWPSPRLVGTHWRERVADPDVLATCLCGHPEQLHEAFHGACTAGPYGRRCSCDAFHAKRQERVA